MFDAWTIAGVGGGAAALTFLAAGRERDGQAGVRTLRLSLDKDGSLLGDVRLLGGGLAWLTSMYTSGDTKKTLQVIATASLLSLGMTEIVRFRLAQTGQPVTVPKGNFMPSWGQNAFGALPSSGAQYGAQHQNQSAWANR